jgi:hypothetical protein
MRELTMQEIDCVSGAMTIDQGLNLIAGISAVCAVIPGLQGAAAFGAGVYLGGQRTKSGIRICHLEKAPRFESLIRHQTNQTPRRSI